MSLFVVYGSWQGSFSQKGYLQDYGSWLYWKLGFKHTAFGYAYDEFGLSEGEERTKSTIVSQSTTFLFAWVVIASTRSPASSFITALESTSALYPLFWMRDIAPEFSLFLRFSVSCCPKEHIALTLSFVYPPFLSCTSLCG